MATRSEQRSERLRKDFYANKYGPQRSGMFRGTNYVSGAQLEAEDAHKRELEMQALKNKGQFDVADRTQTGATKRTGMEQAAETGRHGQTINLDRKKLDWRQASETRGHDLTDQLQTQNFLMDNLRVQQQGKQFNQTLDFKNRQLDLGHEIEAGQLSVNRHDSLKTQSSGLMQNQQSTYQQNLQNFVLSSVDPSAREAFKQRALGQSNNAGGQSFTNTPTMTGPPGTQTQTNALTGTGQRPPIRRKDQDRIWESRQNGVRSFTNAPTRGLY